MKAIRDALLLILPVAAWCAPHPARAEESRESKVLETTTIEGQILFPKVLFISAEDQARFPETLHRAYLRSAFEIASSAPLPKTICASEAGYTTPSAATAGVPETDALAEPMSTTSPSNSQEVNP